MPPKYVKTIQEEIFYEYAKLMSRSAFKGKINYGFVSAKFKELRDGAITMSGTIREWQREQEFPKECVFCGARENDVTIRSGHIFKEKAGCRRKGSH
jgi:hypothetical protein